MHLIKSESTYKIHIINYVRHTNKRAANGGYVSVVGNSTPILQMWSLKTAIFYYS